jgi:ribosome modulation factor
MSASDVSIFTICALFEQGHQASKAGLSREDNPYPESEPDIRSAWDLGWALSLGMADPIRHKAKIPQFDMAFHLTTGDDALGPDRSALSM